MEKLLSTMVASQGSVDASCDDHFRSTWGSILEVPSVRGIFEDADREFSDAKAGPLLLNQSLYSAGTRLVVVDEDACGDHSVVAAG